MSPGDERAPDRERSATASIPDQLRRRARTSAERIAASFTSPLHSAWLGSVLGIALGVTFTVCMVTGLVDYLVQHPPSWFHFPSRPVNLYRVTQGVHVLTGIAAIPLLLGKLWVVYPRLFAWPPVKGLAHALERLSLVPLVGGSLFLLATGVLNIAYWYGPMPFFFPTAHLWAAWIVVGALVIHVGAKATEARAALSARRDGSERADPTEPAGVQPTGLQPAALQPSSGHPHSGLSRRGFLSTLGATSAVLVGAVIGETVAPLKRLAVLAPRVPTTGPQMVPVNQSAVQAGVTQSAVDPAYRLSVTGRCGRPMTFTLDELRDLPQRSAGLPIECVEGWSAAASWRGISVPMLMQLVGAAEGASVRVDSLEASDRLYSSSVLDSGQAADPDTLLALELNGEVLDIDHGFPVRLIAPDRAGVLQTKWIRKVTVL